MYPTDGGAQPQPQTQQPQSVNVVAPQNNVNVAPVINNQVVVQNTIGGVGQKRDYQYNLFGCCGNPLACLYVFFCTPCAAGEIYSGDCCGCNCIIGCCLFDCFPCFYPCIFTSTLRSRVGIKGNCCEDTLLCWCCCPCQMTRELRESRGN